MLPQFTSQQKLTDTALATIQSGSTGEAVSVSFRNEHPPGSSGEIVWAVHEENTSEKVGVALGEWTQAAGVWKP